MRQLNPWEKWAEVRAGLEKILEKTGEEWIPEDVYASILSGESFLFEIGTGFAVVQKKNGLRGPFLFVWCLYMPNGNERSSVISALDEMARQAGCKQIEFLSPRRWDLYFDGEFNQKAVVYERVLK